MSLLEELSLIQWGIYLDNDGYCVKYMNGIPVEIQKIIWYNHHGPIPEGYNVAHINGNKPQNMLSNLKLIQL